jgi:quinol monooxygenase YgiN
MYGTVGRLRIKSGKLAELIGVVRDVEANPGIHTMALVGKDGSDDEYDWTIVWADKATHDANAERPEFPAIYERLLATLAAEPEWHSGEIAYSYAK